MYDTKKRTDFLFAVPSFLSGVATLVDIFGTLRKYNTSRTPEEADARAIASDWGVVGNDMQVGFLHCEHELEKRHAKH